MINFLDMNSFVRYLSPVTSTELLTKNNEFNPDGLFSETIFGLLNSPDRKIKYAYINLHTKIIHPHALKVLIKMSMSLKKFISTENSFILKDGELLIDDENGVTGIDEFMKMFPMIKFRGGSRERDKFIDLLHIAYKKGTLFIDKIPVIPPAMRDAFWKEDGSLVVDPLNDYYIDIMKKASQIRGIGDTGPVKDLLVYRLQLSVNEYDEFIKSNLGHKSGLLRQDILSKRVDFSARAVITPGPDLKVNEIGVPFKIAVSLFEPFLVHKLLYSGTVDRNVLEREFKDYIGLELNVDTLKKLLNSIKSGDIIPKTLYDIIYENLLVVTKNRSVLAKRDPSLQAGNIKAFSIKIVHGDTIQLCTLQTGGFNADFDGDAMALFHPLSDEAQYEIEHKMKKAYSGTKSNSLFFELSKEMFVGLYIITKDITSKNTPSVVNNIDLEKIIDPYIMVKYRNKTTTAGKALFNSCFPENYPFIEAQATKKLIGKIINDLVVKYGDQVAFDAASKLKTIGFKFATICAPTITLDDLELNPELQSLKTKLKTANTGEAVDILDKAESELKNKLRGSGLYDLSDSGSTKGWKQPMQMLFAKGIIADPEGKLLDPITGSFADGFTTEEYFKSASGARKGIVDRTLNTADTGYSTRKLVYLANNVEAHPILVDCRTKRTLDIRLSNENDMMDKLWGRFILDDSGRPIEFDKNKFKPGDVIKLRSPIFCESPKICHTCYGKLLLRHKTPYIGILAGHSIGERGTQLIMRTFHTGGAVTLSKRDILKDILENDVLLTDKFLKENFVQIENKLLNKVPCSIKIKYDDYEDVDDSLVIDESEMNIFLKSLISEVKVGDQTYSFILDYGVNINIHEMNKVKNDAVYLNYPENSELFEVSFEQQDLKQLVRYLERILSGKEIYKDVPHLFMKIFRIKEYDVDTVHLEVLISNCLRDRTNNNLPARLGKKWDPILMNVKKVVFNSGFIQGIGFENINAAINAGLINEAPQEESVLEKIITGNLVLKKED